MSGACESGHGFTAYSETGLPRNAFVWYLTLLKVLALRWGLGFIDGVRWVAGSAAWPPWIDALVRAMEADLEGSAECLWVRGGEALVMTCVLVFVLIR
jgi:hypothetical protein